jgi:hypothetical protein bfra3_16278
MTKIEMEAMEAVIGMRKEIAKANEIDWEQRRYEIAKDLYVQTCQQVKLEGDNTAADVFRSAAWLSRVAADYLIEVLKK